RRCACRKASSANGRCAAITVRCATTPARSIRNISAGTIPIRRISIRFRRARPPARREYMGGADTVIARAREDFRRGEYRWVATVMKEVVFADPGNRAARELEADALEQLGYQAEAGTWRNEYLVGALELRGGAPQARAPSTLSADTLRAVSLDSFFDLLGV